MSWIVHDPMQMVGTEHYDTEAEALAAAASLIEAYNDGDSWDEEVEGIVVARVTHGVAKTVLGVKSEMTQEQWNDLTGGSDCDEWWDFHVSASDPDAVTRLALTDDDLAVLARLRGVGYCADGDTDKIRQRAVHLIAEGPDADLTCRENARSLLDYLLTGEA